VLRAGGAPEEWLEDVRHEAMLILAAKLQKVPNLGLDSKGLAEKFPSSIGTIARNECRQALKRLRRIYRTGAELSAESDFRAAASFYLLQVRSLDLSAAIEELPEPLCSVLRLYQLGHDIRAIAPRLGLTYWEAYRAFRHGLKRLRTDLGLP
jgi:DNA-directed RNA polymerase specialized sigma24 family protein